MSASIAQSGRELYEFGTFRVDPDKQVLLRAGEAVPVTPKTFQILLVLIRHKKEIVTKDDLMRAVWPDTFVEESNLTRSVFMLRKALGETAQDHRYVVTIPGRGYRFAEDVRLVPEEEITIAARQRSRVQVEVEERSSWGWLPAGVLALLLVLTLGLLLWHRPRLSHPEEHALASSGAGNSVVIADFTNTTGDSVFDDTLKQAVSVQLAQSPFLNIVSDERIGNTLKLMGRKRDQRIIADTGREICFRSGGKAYLSGSIANLGTQYVINLDAANCWTGDTLAREQVTAERKEDVLKALDAAATDLRRKVGESLSSIRNFDTPIEQATTSSLEALHAYSLGRRAMVINDDYVTAASLYKQAIGLDPYFAMAYASLGTDYAALGQQALAVENAKRAYELRDKVSLREKFYIESHYFQYAVGDLEKALQVYEVFAQLYPEDWVHAENVGIIYTELGQYDDALTQNRKLSDMAPGSAIPYALVARSYIGLNRLRDAHSAIEEAQANHLDAMALCYEMYLIGFLEKDFRAMAQQVAWATGKPVWEGFLLGAEANTNAYFGKLGKSRELSGRAVESAKRLQTTDIAGNYEAEAAVREALIGNVKEARKHAGVALSFSRGREVQYQAALAFALIGSEARAEALANDLAKRFPEDTMVHFNYLPALYGQLALNRKDFSRAIEALEGSSAYELGLPNIDIFTPALYPVFVRGETYLAAREGNRSAAEFQKVLDHPGIVLNEPIGALARMGLARAYALEGDTAKSRAAYEDFLKLWKDADPNVPVLQQAKKEYAKLR